MTGLSRGEHCKRIAQYVKDNPLFKYQELGRETLRQESKVSGVFTVGGTKYYLEITRWTNSTAVMIRGVAHGRAKALMTAPQIKELYEEVKKEYEVEILRETNVNEVRDSRRPNTRGGHNQKVL